MLSLYRIMQSRASSMRDALSLAESKRCVRELTKYVPDSSRHVKVF